KFGETTDIPTPGDYDGTGKLRIALFRPRNPGFVVRADDGSEIKIALGQTGDTPVPASFGFTSAAPVLSLDRDIQPIFDANCLGCHGRFFPSAGMDLSAGHSYNSLVNG